MRTFAWTLVALCILGLTDESAGSSDAEPASIIDVDSTDRIREATSEKEILSFLLRSAEKKTETWISPDSPLWNEYRKGKDLLRGKNASLATEVFSGIIKSATGFVPAYYYLGSIAANEKRPDDALHYYESALKIYPDFALARANLGNLHYRYCRFQKAAEEYERVLVAAPNFAEVHRRLAQTYSEDRSRFHDASLHFRRYLELKGDTPDREEVEKMILQLELSGKGDGKDGN